MAFASQLCACRCQLLRPALKGSSLSPMPKMSPPSRAIIFCTSKVATRVASQANASTSTSIMSRMNVSMVATPTSNSSPESVLAGGADTSQVLGAGMSAAAERWSRSAR